MNKYINEFYVSIIFVIFRLTLLAKYLGYCFPKNRSCNQPSEAFIFRAFDGCL